MDLIGWKKTSFKTQEKQNKHQTMMMPTRNQVAAVAAVPAAVVFSFYMSKRLRSWFFATLWKRVQYTCDLAITDRKKEFLGTIALSGTVLDVGSGAGIQLQYITSQLGITEILCVEPNHRFKEALEKEIAKAIAARPKEHPIKITAYYGTAEEYFKTPEGAAKKYDNVTCFLVLCSVPTPLPIIKNLHDECLKPGGKLVFIEHVCPNPGLFCRACQVIQPVYGLFADGCTLTRHTVETILSAGDWEDVQSSLYFSPKMSIPLPFLFGVATKRKVK
jgi:SAM-dependent methyltransferase